MTAESFVNVALRSGKVVIFSKTYCPYCLKAKKLFEDLKQPCIIHELDQIENGAEIQNYLHGLTGLRTVPNIFINGRHIGGCDDTLKLHKEGELVPLLKLNSNYN